MHIMKRPILLISLSLFIAVQGCKKDDESEIKIQTQTKTFISEGANDGIILNSTPKLVKDYYSGGQGKEITIGWDANGFAMRGFISFDVLSISPSTDKVLVIEDAVLKVYEANTNLNPFSGDGFRTVDCFLVDYKTLDINDYDDQYLGKCGVIASSGYSVLTEHPLNVTTQVASLIKSYPSTNKFQFRLQISSDGNVSNDSSLKQAMWNIFSGDETQLADYRPVLVIKYHYVKK